MQISYTLSSGLELYGEEKSFDKEYCNTITSTRSSSSPKLRKSLYAADGRSFYADLNIT